MLFKPFCFHSGLSSPAIKNPSFETCIHFFPPRKVREGYKIFISCLLAVPEFEQHPNELGVLVKSANNFPKCQFPMASVTSYHKLVGSKKQKLILSQFRRLEV